MTTEEGDGGEFQEKAGLKRKLTGPPRLILGKPRSPGRDEIKSDAHVLRQQKRHKFSKAVKDTAAERQDYGEADYESQCVTCLSPQPAFTGAEEAASPELQSLEVTSSLGQSRVKKQQGKKRLRSGAKATLRRVFYPTFACVKRRKKADIKSEEDSEDNSDHCAQVNCQDVPGNGDTTEEPLTISRVSSGITKGCKTGVLKHVSARNMCRNLRVRIWPFFKKPSGTSERNPRHEEGNVRPCSFIETASEKSVEPERRSITEHLNCDAAEPFGAPAVDEHLNGLSEIHEDKARIPAEICPVKHPDTREEGTEMLKVGAEVSEILNTPLVHDRAEQVCCPKQDVCKHNHVSYTVDEEDKEVEIIEILEPVVLLHSEVLLPSVNACSSDTEVTATSSDVSVCHVIAHNDTYKTAPIENEVQCKPVITIDAVHSSDKENQDPIENNPPQWDRLSAVLSVNGSCYPLKMNSMAKDAFQTLDQSEHKSKPSETELVQAALSLVRVAISDAVEQLSAELQSNRTDLHYA